MAAELISPGLLGSKLILVCCHPAPQQSSIVLQPHLVASELVRPWGGGRNRNGTNRTFPFQGLKLSSPGRRPWAPQRPVLGGARRQDSLAGTAQLGQPRLPSPTSFGIGSNQQSRVSTQCNKSAGPQGGAHTLPSGGARQPLDFRLGGLATLRLGTREGFHQMGHPGGFWNEGPQRARDGERVLKAEGAP